MSWRPRIPMRWEGERIPRKLKKRIARLTIVYCWAPAVVATSPQFQGYLRELEAPC